MNLKKWKIFVNSSEYEKGRAFEVSFMIFFSDCHFHFWLYLSLYSQLKRSFLKTYRKFIHVYNAQKQQESLKILLHSLTHFWISFTTHQAETNVNNELFIPPCTVSYMWTCFCLNIIVHVLFTRGDSSESHIILVFLPELSFSCNLLIRNSRSRSLASIKPCFRPRADRVQFEEARAFIADYLYAETILTMFNKLLVFLLSVRNNRTISLLWKCCHRLEQVLCGDHKSNSSFSSCMLSSLADLNQCRKELLKRLYSLMAIIYSFHKCNAWE